ncbi:hypothetical protein G6F68_017324 [Rhizopus microsporus]|nr:hypothetical protein G6F68_017324 [Rhizopus microsporus]
MDTGTGLRAAVAGTEPGDGETVRRNGILVRTDQDRGDLRADHHRRRPGRVGLHLAQWPHRSAVEPVE